MAKHKKHKSRPSMALARPITMSAPRPIVLKQTKVVHQKAKHKKGHRRSGGGLLGGLGSSAGGLLSKNRIGVALGAAAFGLLEKQTFFASIPALPIIGKAGTIALGAYFLSDGGKNALANDICTAALAVAAHELASTGSIQGGEPDVDGAQYVAGY